MNADFSGLTALLLYVAAAACFANQKRLPGLLLTVLALAGHGHHLAPNFLTSVSANSGLFSAGSTVGWCVVALILLLNLRLELSSLAVVVLPLAALALALDLWLPSPLRANGPAPLGMHLHIALAILAYSLFAIATMQALLLWVATRQLRQHHPGFSFFPPLPTMEAVMFQLTALAFTLLTVSLALGALYVTDIRAQHLAHKIVFSILAWIVFAVLVYGRWQRGWRGRHGIRYVIAGFVLLALAFFGTKFVLQIILQKV